MTSLACIKKTELKESSETESEISDFELEEDSDEEEEVNYEELLGKDSYKRLYEYFYSKCGHHYLFMDDYFKGSPKWDEICRKHRDHEDRMKLKEKLDYKSIQKFINESPNEIKNIFQDLIENGVIREPGMWYYEKKNSFESLDEFVDQFWDEIGESWMIYPCKDRLRNLKEDTDSYIWESTKELVGKLHKMIYWSKVNLIDLVIQIKKKERIGKDFLSKCIEIIKEIDEGEERNIEKYGYEHNTQDWVYMNNSANADSVLDYCCEKLSK